MELKLYEWNKKNECYDYCGGYLTFKSYKDLSDYLYILMSDMFYDSFIIEFFVDLRDYAENELKDLNNNTTLCMFKVKNCGSLSHYKICISKNFSK